jgi:hypothetical protein
MIKHNCTSKDHSDFVCVDPSPALPLKGREALSQMMMSYIIFLTSTNLPLPFKGYSLYTSLLCAVNIGLLI